MDILTNATALIEEANSRIHEHILETPLLESEPLNNFLGVRVLIKAESQQRTGSFKVRGAFNHLLQLSDDEKRKGVVAISSGNHAQAVAYAAAKLAVEATIVMPSDAPRIKLERTRAFGANVILYDRATEDREAIGQKLSQERELYFIHPYNDARTFFGQATLGLELSQQCGEQGIAPDAIISNCGGGGLSSGIALSTNFFDMSPKVYIAEPNGFDDAQRSLKTGELIRNNQEIGSICDAILTRSLGSKTFPILQQFGVVGLTASDTAVQAAMYLYQKAFDLVVEPGGAAALACLCLNRHQFENKTVIVLATGGNVDPDAHKAIVAYGNKHFSVLEPITNSQTSKARQERRRNVGKFHATFNNARHQI